jgi:glycosyltransferase involved in cell wall biosynthesis
LDAALESLAAQTFKNFEAVVVNDGGDSVARVVERRRGQFPVALFDLEDHSGPSAARNVGIDNAAGSHIAFLDDDDVFLPDHLATAARELARTQADFVYLGAVVCDARHSRLPNDWRTRPRKQYPFNEEFLLVANYVHTGAVVVRNFQDSPVRFDERLSHCEDWDLWLALRHHLHYQFTSVDAITTIYHQIADAEGLVSQGQATIPSPFSVVRERLYARWATDDVLVSAYRDFMLTLDASCNDRVAIGQEVPIGLFDRALRSLYGSFVQGEKPDYALIAHILENHPR